VKIVIIHQGREDIFLSRGSLGNKEARLKIVFSTVVYILFFSLLDTLRMNWSNNLSKKLRNSYNAMKRLLREINI
jgi:hypothetical protein